MSGQWCGGRDRVPGQGTRPALDIPETGMELGRRLAASRAPISLKADGHVAEGMALIALGRPANAFSQFDSAALLLGRPDMELESAEWRVVSAAAGLLQVPQDKLEQGRRRLAEIAGRDPSLARRAAWALVLDADAAGDSATARRWSRALQADSGAETEHLQRLAQAFQAETMGRHQRALALSTPLLRDQFLPHGRDPFTRTVLHELRANALERLGDIDGAIRERLWAENRDIGRLLHGPVQAVEVDWTASVYSDRVRARLSVAKRDTAQACHLLSRIARFWTDVEPTVAPARAESQRLSQEACH